MPEKITRYILLASIAGNFANNLRSICEAKSIGLQALFITTAANPYKEKQWMEDDIALFISAGFSIERIDISTLTREEFELRLSKTAICIMGGGNPIYLLEVIKEKDVMSSLQKRVAEGMLYVGSSAGAVITSPNIKLEKHFEDRAEVTPLDSYDSLGLVNFQVLPHWGKPSYAKEYMQMLQDAYRNKETVIPLRDDQAIEILDDKMQLIRQ